MKNLNTTKLIVLLVLLLAVTQLTQATDYFVQTTGNDTNDGLTEATAWASVSKAFKTVPKDAGHTIRIGTGTFTEAAMITAPSGTTIMGEGTDKTVIASKAETFFLINKAKNVTIQDFTIDGLGVTKERLLYINESSHIKVLRVDLRNGEGTGFWASKVKNIIVDGGVYTESGGRGTVDGDVSVVEWNLITNGVFQNVTINDQKAQSWRGWSDMSGVIITKCVFKGCPSAAWNNGNSGNISMEWWGVTNVTNCEISYCSMNGTISMVGDALGKNGMWIHHCDITGNYGFEMTMSNLEVDHNYIHNSIYAFANWVPDGVFNNQVIHHNVLYKMNPPVTLMLYKGALTNSKVYNNTFYAEFDAGYVYMEGAITNLEFKNNIFVNKKASTFNNYKQVTDYNLFQYTKPVGDHAIQANPNFVSTSTGFAGMQLQAGSPAIDAGILIPGITDNATDGKPDLGAFEFGETWTVGPNSPDAKQVQSIVSISSPKADQLFSLPTKITINAEAMSLETVAKVEFFADGSKIGEDLTAPYSYIWSDATKGNILLTVVLTDGKGQITKSRPVQISVSGISTKLTSPLTGAKFTAPTSLSLAATASTISGSIKKVEFYANDLKLGEDDTEPYTLYWENVGAGNFKLKTVAWDELNFSNESAVVTINVSNSTEILLATSVPTIDGIKDNIYSGVVDSVKLVAKGTISSKEDLSSCWTAVHDKDNLYLFANITDDQLIKDSPEWYNDDCVEVFIDADNSKDNTYGENDFAYWFGWNRPAAGEEKHKALTGVEFKIVKTATGYDVEAKIPWATMGGKPAGNLIGIDIQVNDDDNNGGERDTETHWNTNTGDAWQFPYLLGTVKLSDKTTSVQGLPSGNSDFVVFPNPTNGTVFIQSETFSGANYTLMNILGKVLETGQLKSSNHAVQIGQAGVYLLQINDGNKTQTQKIVVK